MFQSSNLVQYQLGRSGVGNGGGVGIYPIIANYYFYPPPSAVSGGAPGGEAGDHQQQRQPTLQQSYFYNLHPANLPYYLQPEGKLSRIMMSDRLSGNALKSREIDIYSRKIANDLTWRNPSIFGVNEIALTSKLHYRGRVDVLRRRAEARVGPGSRRREGEDGERARGGRGR